MLITKNILFIFIALFATTIYANDTLSQPDLIKKNIIAFMEKNQIPGVAVELIVDGKPQSYYFGYANLEKKTPITKDTIFELGSISKVMTSLLVAEQVDAAQMQLETSVRQYLPTLPDEFDDVTVQSLATHTSGLSFMPPGNIKTKNELDAYLAQWYPDYVIDEAWLYSNMGVGILGDALQQSMHHNLNHLYRSYVMSPLHMQLIGLEVPATLQKNYAQGYDDNNIPVAHTDLGLFPAAISVKASANDMQNFLSAAIGLPGTPERILYPMRMTQAAYMKLPHRMQGLGWVIHPLSSNDVTAMLSESGPLNFGPDPVELMEQPKFQANTLIDKGGMTNGFRAYIAVIPGKKSGIVVLINKNKMNNDMIHVAREILLSATNLMPVAVAGEKHDEQETTEKG